MFKLVLYGAPWCGPCKQQKTILDANKIAYEYVDIEADPSRAKEAHVKSVPTLHILKGGHLYRVLTSLTFATEIHKLMK